MSKPHLHLVVDPFPYNRDAQNAWRELAIANNEVSDCIDKISPESVGAPGSAERMREAIPLLERAAEIIKPVVESEEEDRRFIEYDVPGR